MANLITTRRRCPVCKAWLEVGEKFEFMKLRYQGTERTIPVHREHVYPLEGLQKELTILAKRGMSLDVNDVSSGGMVELMKYFKAGYKPSLWISLADTVHTKVFLKRKNKTNDNWNYVICYI